MKYIKLFESFNKTNDRPLKDKTDKELHQLTTDKTGEERREVIRELSVRYQKKLGKRDEHEDIDWKNPKVSKIDIT